MATTADQAPATPAHLDQSWQRGLLEELCDFERETASAGEHEAARWLVARLAERGAAAEVEEEPGHHTFWWPLGLACLAGAAAGLWGLRARSPGAAALGLAAAAAAADDLPPGGRRLRALLPKRRATNVVATMGPSHAKHTVVLAAHHDAPHSGFVFHPGIPETLNRVAPKFFEITDTSPPLIWPAVGGPLLAGVGAATGRRALSAAGAVVSAGFAAAMADIGLRRVVPGANDNGTGVVALIGLALALAERPTQNVRVMFVSTSEEALCEGMRAFASRHFAELPVENTFFCTLETLGSPHLLVLRGEGMLGMREYPAEALAMVDGLAEELGIWLFPNLRLRNATDGVFPLTAGYQCASICSCTDLKQPANYHWPTDLPENVDYGTLADAIRLAEALVRRLDERWI